MTVDTAMEALIGFCSGLMERDDWKNLGLSNLDRKENDKDAKENAR